MKYINLLFLTAILFSSLAVKADKGNLNKQFNSNKPMLFMENKGQVHDLSGKSQSSVLYSLSGGNVNISLEANAIHYTFFKNKNNRLHAYRLDMALVGSNLYPVIIGEEKQVYQENFYLANGAAITNVGSFKKIVYLNVYPNIDWVIYLKNNKLEYDFVVRPGGDVSDIKMEYKGAKKIKIERDGRLSVGTGLGNVTEKKPYAFIKETGKTIDCNFNKNKSGIVSFKAGLYKANGTLVIDPSIVWATYYGGNITASSYSGDDVSFGVATDYVGNVFMVGQTFTDGVGSNAGVMQGASTGYTVQQPAMGVGSTGVGDVFLVKFNAAGARLWGTYYGGAQNERGMAVACDGLGKVYITGYTNSPLGIATSGSYQSTFSTSSNDAFLVKFDSAGVREWGTYYGNSSGASRGTAVACDISNNVYIGGYTLSSGTTLSTAGSFQSTSSATSSINDGFLVKFNSTGTRLWSTYYGGAGEDKVLSVASDASENVFIGGVTTSTETATAANTSGSMASVGAQQISAGGGTNSDAFLAKFNSGGTRLWGTFYGATDVDQANAIQCDGLGNVYMGGSSNTAKDNTALSTAGSLQPKAGGANDGILVKFNSSGVRQWATYYGGANTEQINAIAINTDNNVYVVGQSSTPGTNNVSTLTTNLVGTHPFLALLNSDGTRQFGTYLGGTTNKAASPGNSIENGNGVACDQFGNAYVTGFTNSGDFSATSDAYQSIFSNAAGTNSINYDAFLIKYQGTTSLPLKLLDFKAVVNDDNVKNIWLTSNEINVKNFDIEKSIDGLVFTYLGRVEANNTISTNSYAYIDYGRLAGTVYYRLKMIDIDGKFSYSSIVAVSKNPKNNYTIYKNPVEGSAVFAHPALATKTVAYILSIEGKRLETIPIEASSIQTNFDASDLAAGTYLLQYIDGKKEQVLKFVKL